VRPFIKVIPAGAQDLGAQPQLVKVSSSGLFGDDLAAFVKRAGHTFVDKLRRLDKHPGEELIHLIAVGADEAFGVNKNGDLFKEAVCRKYHPTFVEHARFFRNHDNKNKSRSYGVVKLSAYNEAMRRIELIVGLNATKEAAARNGGLVADEEMEKLARGEDLPVSMSCIVSHDVCTGCHNKARSRDEYCTGTDEGGLCKRGGLKSHITRICEDGHVLAADNPDPKFFDISKVWRPADRIAYVLGRVKSAADSRPVSGAELAELLIRDVPPDIFALGMEIKAAEQAKALALLAAEESSTALDPAASRHADNRIFDRRLVKLAAPEAPPAFISECCRALSDRQVLLDVEEFLRLRDNGGVLPGAEKAAADAARPHLPRAFRDLAAANDLEALLTNNPYTPAIVLSPRRDAVLADWALAKEADFGLSPQRARARLLRQTIRYEDAPALAPLHKAAAAGAEPARAYALYVTAFLAHQPADTRERLAKLAVRQNFAI